MLCSAHLPLQLSLDCFHGMTPRVEYLHYKAPMFQQRTLPPILKTSGGSKVAIRPCMIFAFLEGYVKSEELGGFVTVCPWECLLLSAVFRHWCILRSVPVEHRKCRAG